MCADDPLERLAAEVIAHDLAPQRLDLAAFQAGVDQGPAVAVGQQPNVDVVEHERQRQA